MLNLKYKVLIALLMIVSVTGQALFFIPAPVYANHSSCSGSADSTERCVQDRRQTANVLCFENNAGDNEAISSCVDGVTAHFTSAGPREDAPELPESSMSAAAAASVCDGSQDGSVICAPDCVYKDDSGNCVNCNIQDSNSACNLFKYIDLAISTLAAMMGIVVVIMIIVGGIQYTTAGSDFNAVQKAKKRIGSAIGALVVFGLIYAIIQYLVPGGIF